MASQAPCHSELTWDFRFHVEIVFPEEDAPVFRVAPGQQTDILEAHKSWKGDRSDLCEAGAQTGGVLNPVGGDEAHPAGQQGQQDQNEAEQTDDAHLWK